MPDSDVVPEINNCQSRAWAFEAEARGWVDAEFGGIGSYTFQSTPDPVTQVTLRRCEGGLAPDVLTLTYFGTGRVEEGEHIVMRTPTLSEPGFTFSFTQSSRPGNEPIRRCDDRPIGRVFIDAIDGRRLRGRFDIEAGCIDQETFDNALRPQETWFRGWFEAENVGQE